MSWLTRFGTMIAVILITYASMSRADVLDDIVMRFPDSWAAGKIAAARAGDPDAQFVVGRGLVDGTWAGRETKIGLEWLRKAADKGQRYAAFSLGRMYALGQYGIPVDIDQAQHWYERSFNEGNAYAAFQLARLNKAKSPPNVEKALLWYRRGAEAGDFDCQRVLGELYGAGGGLPLDYGQSLYWLLRAMAQGPTVHAEDVDRIQARLGAYYENGLGTARSIADALRWYREAARNGNADASYALGQFYESGEGVAPNQSEAMTYYEAGAERGHPLAQYRLGRGFASGAGVAADRVQAIKWLTLASRRCCELSKEMVEWWKSRPAESLLSWRVDPRDFQKTIDDAMKTTRAELDRVKRISTPDQIEAGETLAEDFHPVQPPMIIREPH